MVITIQRWLGIEDDRREELEFLLGEIPPLLAQIRESYALLSREGGDVPGEQAAFDRLLAARQRLKDALGEALIEHVAEGGRVELGR